MRIKRGTLPSTREHGRLYVLLHDEPTRSDTERLIYTLEEQLRLEREAHAEARRLLAAALERIPLEAPPGARGSPETPSDLSPGTETPPDQETSSTRPWWRRMFGA
jgi:hypothetical protein